MSLSLSKDFLFTAGVERYKLHSYLFTFDNSNIVKEQADEDNEIEQVSNLYRIDQAPHINNKAVTYYG